MEEILAFCERFMAEPRFQEDFTRALAAEFNARVKTIGSHGPVRTECEAGA